MPVTPSHDIRIPDDLWGPGKAKARRERTTLPAKIRSWIAADLRGELQVIPRAAPGASREPGGRLAAGG